MSGVLILTTAHGSSHRRASEALQLALRSISPWLTVEIIDALRHCARWFRAYYDSYEIPLRYWPGLWRRIESYQHQQPSTGPGWLYRMGARPLFRYLAQRNPRVVVATEVGVCEIAAMYKRRTHSNFYLLGLELMDFNRAWVQPEVDLYPVVHPDLVRELVEAGVPAAKILVSGMPINPAYTNLPGRAEARARLGLRPDRPVLLVLFGGSGFGRPREIITELKNVSRPFQAIFIAGRNRGLERELIRRAEGLPEPRVLGWVGNMHEWMAAADLLLSKPGGATVMEASACGLPLLAFGPLPGNEERTCTWLAKWGVGVWIKCSAQLAPTVERLLENPKARDELAASGRSVSRPHAARDIAEAILKAIERPRETHLA